MEAASLPLPLYSLLPASNFPPPTDKQIKVGCVERDRSRGLVTYFHGSFIIRIHRREYLFFLSFTIWRSTGGSSKRLDTDGYSRLRVFAYATGGKIGWNTVLEGVRRRVDGQRNAFSGRQWWPFVTRGNVFIP